MTREELARCDGREGRRACVAVSGKVYDVSDSPRWQGGDHEGRHRAGCDLTAGLAQAPHVRAVVERFPVVERLAEKAGPAPRNRTLPIVAGIAALLLAR